MATRSKAYVCGRSPVRLWVRIPPGAWMFVCCECCVLSGRGLCDELVTRPQESYRLCCVVVCDLENLKNEEAMTRVGSQCHRKKSCILLIAFIINAVRTSEFSYVYLSCLLCSPTQAVWPFGLMSFTQRWHWHGCGLKYHHCYYHFFSHGSTALVGLGLLTAEISRSHSD